MTRYRRPATMSAAMMSTGTAASGSAPAGRAPAGPALTALRGVAVWAVSFIRAVVIAYIAVQVVIWHSFYSADAWRLAGPVAAVAWEAAVVAYLRRRWLPWQLAGLDSGAHVLLALGAGWCVPAAMRGDTANWLYIVMAGQLFVPAWLAPTAVAAPLVLASGVSYWAGAAAAPAATTGGGSPAGAGIRLVVIAVAAWSARRMLERSAAGTDVTLAQADRDAREQRVVLSRSTERREHERLLHDTVLNTLTALARPGRGCPGRSSPGRGDRDEVVGRCRRDIALMEYALSDPAGPAQAAGRPYGGLLIGIEAAAIEMRARGLDVHVQVAGAVEKARVPARVDASSPLAELAPQRGVEGGSPRGQIGHDPAVPPEALVVPAPVAVAMSYAVREALANVVSHAGTSEAWVEVSLGPADGETGPGPGGDTGPDGEDAALPSLQVTVRDAGAGFDPAHVDALRLGLRRSIIERITERGGRASIWSAPGQGTVVSLRWTASAQARRPALPVAELAPRRGVEGEPTPRGPGLTRAGPADGLRVPW